MGFVLTVLDLGNRLTSPERRAYVALWFVVFVASIATAGWKLYRRIDALEKEREPKFEIVFEPENDRDSRPYVMTSEIVEPPQVFGIAAHTVRRRKYRVGIRSLSKAIVPNVSLVLARCSPLSAHNNIHIGHRLTVMDTDPPQQESDLPPTDSGEPSLFFDVVFESDGSESIPERFGFCYANPKVLRVVDYDLHQGEYSFNVTLRAFGGGYSCERDFKIFKEFRKHDWRDVEPVMMEPL